MKILFVLILLSATFGCVGCYITYCNNRLNGLKLVYDFIDKLKYFVCIENRTYKDTFENYNENSDDDVCDIAVNCYIKLVKGNSLSEAWIYAVDNSENIFCEKDRRILKSVCNVLGMTDTDGQEKSLSTLQKKLNERILLYRNYKKKKLSADCTVCVAVAVILSFLIL